MDETLLDQLQTDLSELFKTIDGYQDMTVKLSYEELPDITYPLVIIDELINSDVDRYYDGKEHIIDVAYQITILADQNEIYDAVDNVRNIRDIIKNYMRGERYHALRRQNPQPIVPHPTDKNIRMGYMRYNGCINIDTNTIYRRN